MAPKLERSEAKSGLNEHKDRNFGLEREPISRQVIPVNGLFKLPDLLRAEAQHLEEWEECVNAQWMILAKPHVGGEGLPHRFSNDGRETEVGVVLDRIQKILTTANVEPLRL